jgi:hypothetical protein
VFNQPARVNSGFDVKLVMTEENEQKGMHRRRVKLSDGRYLLFYTFDDLPAPRAETQKAGEEASEREPQPEAEEERRV